MMFSVNICGEQRSVQFYHLANLFDPFTIHASFEHDGSGPVGGIKDDRNEWNTRPHFNRIIEVDEAALGLFALLYDAPGTAALEARLPALHATELVQVLRKVASYPKRLGDLTGDYDTTEMWHETNAVIDGTIRRDTRFSSNLRHCIISGPHFSVANPCFKTPRAVCIEKSDYDPVDLTTLPAEYVPRSNYSPACDPSDYETRTPRVTWGERPIIVSLPRLVARKMLNLGSERTLRTAIIPAEVEHIHGCYSFAFRTRSALVSFAAGTSSLPYDFLVRMTGKANFGDEIARYMPLFQPCSPQLAVRTLLLNCVTRHYSDLWCESFQPDFAADQWAKQTSLLSAERFRSLKAAWTWSTPLRTDYERRQALVEMDVLVAIELGLTLEELGTIYRIQFSVLRHNEADTWYDRNGRIVFTCSKALPGIGFSRAEWEGIRNMNSGTVSREIDDDTLPGGPRKRTITYEAPFDRCDREEDYKTAWAEFEKRRATKEAKA